MLWKFLIFFNLFQKPLGKRNNSKKWENKKYLPILHKVTCSKYFIVKNTVMQIEKAQINDRLSVLKVFQKFGIPTIYNSAVIYPWNLLFSEKVAYFLIISIVFSIYKQNFTAQ